MQRKLFQSLVLSFSASLVLAQGCGIDWSLPTHRFSRVNEFGKVSYWEQIGAVDVGNGMRLPININFRSDRHSVSPILGTGWLVGLLESSIYQVDETNFLQYDPGGRYRYFWRKPNATILDGEGGWKGEIKGDVTRLYSSCGWKLTYTNGKLTEMASPEHRVFQFAYTANGGVDLNESGRTLLKVAPDPTDKNVKTISFNKQTFRIKQDSRPQVQSVNGVNVIGGVTASLAQITSETYQHDYAFAVDKLIQPTLKITKLGGEPVELTWNPKSDDILKDGDWTYAVKSAEFPKRAERVDRVDSRGEKEFTTFDATAQTETLRTKEGFEVTRQAIPIAQAGGFRSVTKTYEPEKITVKLNNSFDEYGRLLRTVKDINGLKSIAEYRLSPDGQLVEVLVDNTTIWKK